MRSLLHARDSSEVCCFVPACEVTAAGAAAAAAAAADAGVAAARNCGFSLKTIRASAVVEEKRPVGCAEHVILPFIRQTRRQLYDGYEDHVVVGGIAAETDAAAYKKLVATAFTLPAYESLDVAIIDID
jgi:hypothetical protein